MSSKIVNLYGMGLNFWEISSHIEEIYDVEYLKQYHRMQVTKVKEWQSCPLESMYTIVWFDAMHYKMKDCGYTKSRAVNNVLAINKDSRKELIKKHVSENEGASF